MVVENIPQEEPEAEDPDLIEEEEEEEGNLFHFL